MSTLVRAPKECGSWFWDVEESAAPELEAALGVAAGITEVLERHALLTPITLEYKWYVRGSGPTGVKCALSIFSPLSDPSLPARVTGSRPIDFPNAEIMSFDVIGTGTWIDSEGNARKEPRLVDLSVAVDPYGPTATLSVHHDIWSYFDFSGQPHAEVQSRNAPRLAQALSELTSTLGTAPEPGEPTYFGVATAFGIATPDADERGFGPDLTDKL